MVSATFPMSTFFLLTSPLVPSNPPAWVRRRIIRAICLTTVDCARSRLVPTRMRQVLIRTLLAGATRRMAALKAEHAGSLKSVEA